MAKLAAKLRLRRDGARADKQAESQASSTRSGDRGALGSSRKGWKLYKILAKAFCLNIATEEDVCRKRKDEPRVINLTANAALEVEEPARPIIKVPDANPALLDARTCIREEAEEAAVEQSETMSEVVEANSSEDSAVNSHDVTMSSTNTQVVGEKLEEVTMEITCQGSHRLTDSASEIFPLINLPKLAAARESAFDSCATSFGGGCKVIVLADTCNRPIVAVDPKCSLERSGIDIIMGVWTSASLRLPSGVKLMRAGFSFSLASSGLAAASAYLIASDVPALLAMLAFSACSSALLGAASLAGGVLAVVVIPILAILLKGGLRPPSKVADETMLVGCATLTTAGFLGASCLVLKESAVAIYPGSLACLAFFIGLLGVVSLLGGFMLSTHGCAYSIMSLANALVLELLRMPLTVGQLIRKLEPKYPVEHMILK